MQRRYTISRNYTVPARIVWADLINYQSLADSMEGHTSYQGLPEGDAKEGHDFTIKVKRGRFMPSLDWTIKVVERNDETMVMRTEERGGPVKVYKHRLNIIPIGPGACTYSDELDVDAGLLTPVIAPMFREMYEKRHDARKARLEHKAT